MFEGIGVGLAKERVRIFLSYDREHDGDLHDLLVDQASTRTSGFEISSRSQARPPTDLWDERLRRDIQEADEVIVICGEHTDCSGRVAAELRIAQEEKRPYFLLSGAGGSSCAPSRRPPGRRTGCTAGRRRSSRTRSSPFAAPPSRTSRSPSRAWRS